MKKLFPLLITLFIPFTITICSGCNQESQETKETILVDYFNDFTGITFDNKTFEYDGESHSIYCSNVPSFASVTYQGNNQTEPGEYVVHASITANNYTPLNLSATMAIVQTEKNFTNLVFESLTVEYDGNPHTITVQNLPSFASVVYKNNSKTGVGTYNATATVSAEGYKTVTLSATLKITPKTFSGITFNSQTISYDGNYHSLYVEGAPEFASVSYSGNNKKEIGTYTVSATIKATGYTTLTLTATMKIVKMLPKISSLTDRTLIYDGTAQLVSFTYPTNLPSYTEMSFKVDGKSVESKNDLRVTSVGEHTVSVTLTNTQYSYEPSTTTAKIKVIENTIGTTNPDKTAFKISSNLKYKTLRDEILKGNFTVKEDYYDDKYYPGGAEEHKLGSTTYYYVDSGEMFSFYDSFDREDSTYKLNENSYSHTKIVGDNVLTAVFEDGILDKNINCYKYPSYAYNENIIGEIGLQCMAYLKESATGGFENSQEGGYKTTYGSFEIDEVNNRFIMTTVRHYYHTEFNHDERTVLTIYNIGNTKINIIDEFKVDNISSEYFSYYRFKYNGFEYLYIDSSFRVSTSFNAVTCCYLDEGSYIVPAKIDDIPVKEYTVGYYDKYYDNDCSGYTLKLYCDDSGVYQGQYADLGQIKGFKNLDVFIDDLGNVLYSGEW